MTPLVIKSDKKKLTKSQSTFNRLIKQVEKLQKKTKEIEATLNRGLHYYHSNVRPAEEKLVKSLLDCIPAFYSYYKHPKSKLSKKEHKILKDLIRSLLNDLSNHILPQEMSAEMVEIISAIEGKDFKKSFDAEVERFKQETKDFAAEQGLDVDLSDVDLTTGSKEEITERLQRALFEALQNGQAKAQEQEKVQKKSKKQLQKEQQAKEVEELQKKGLSKIYKQLAKTLHPDLELDPVRKAEKETLMKKLTTAYDNHDLHTLLSLEVTWMSRNAANEDEIHPQQADDQLNIYNAILKEQIEELEQELYFTYRHPKYCDIQHILTKGDINHFNVQQDPLSIFSMLKDEEERLSHDAERNFLTAMELRESSNFTLIKQIIKDVSDPSPSDLFDEIMRLF